MIGEPKTVASDRPLEGARSPGGDGLFEARCVRPWLVARFPRPQSMLSWALARPGFQSATEAAWLEVSEADLPIGLDPHALLARRMAEAGLNGAVAMMTSRDVRRHHLADAASGSVRARCLATVGLANAARVGDPPAAAAAGFGTINLLVAASIPLTAAALVEALSVAAQARTAAVMELGHRPRGALATGTGTDCIVVAAPEGDGGAVF